MVFVQSDWIRKCSASVLIALFTLPVSLVAETAHVVSPAELTKQTVAASQARQENIEKVRNFLSNPAAAETLRRAHVDSQQVKNAVSQLSDRELAQLTARADKAQQDFAAGHLTTRDIALIILGVALLILIIVIAK